MTPKTDGVAAAKPDLRTRLLGDPKVPLLWPLVWRALTLLVVLGALIAAVDRVDMLLYAVFPGLIALLVSVVHRGPGRFVRGASVGALVALLGGAAVLISGSWLVAGVVAGIVFFATTAAKEVPAWRVEPDFVALGYVIAVFAGSLMGIGSGEVWSVLLAGVTGTAAGPIVEAGFSLSRSAEEGASSVVGTTVSVSLSDAVPLMTRLSSPVVRFAIVRGLTLGVGVALMTAFEANRNVGWVLIAVFSIMRAVPDDTVAESIGRSAATGVAVLLVGAASIVSPKYGPLGLALLGVLAALLYLVRSRFIATTGGTMAAIAAAGAASGTYLEWAGARLLDTIVGAAIAMAVIFIAMPIVDRLSGDAPTETRAEE